MQQRHRLGSRGRLVEERCRRDLHACQIAHHGLKIQEPFETALRNFSLIGRVRRVPAGILEHVPENHAWYDRVRVPEADVRLEHTIPGRNRTQIAEEFVFRLPGRQIQLAARPDSRRNRFVDECIHRGCAHHLQHVRGVFRAWSDVARLERLGIENAHFTRSAYCDASRRLPVADGSASLILIIQLLCGFEFTCSGLSLSPLLTSTTSPAVGEYSSDTALTDSIVPKDCPALSFVPTSGRSMYTTSPSCC